MDRLALPAPRVVVGLDFGTTFTGYGYAHKSTPDDVFTRSDWPMYEQGGGKPYCKTLSALYYKPDGAGELKLHSWGWQARVDYFTDLQTGQSNPGTPVGELVTRFKLHLASERDGPRSAEPLPPGLKPTEVITDQLMKIGEFVVGDLRGRYGTVLTKEVIQWCVTVPSIWDDRAKQQMKECMEKAGLVAGFCSAHGSPYPLIIALEPEAASVYCHKHMHSDLNLQYGDKVLVADFGGGTTDIVVQERVNVSGSLKVKEVTRSSGGLCGGTYVDKRFLEFLCKKIGCLKEFLRQHPATETKVLGWWETAKGTFDDKPNFTATYQLSRKLAVAWEEFEKGNESIESFDEVELSREDMTQIFDPIIQQNIDLIQKQMEETDDIKIVMMVGGFAASPYLRAMMTSRFLSQVKEIISPPDPGSAVLQGAVISALNPDTIVSRVSRKTYGINTSMPYECGVDPVDFLTVVGSEPRCTNRFDIYVRTGDEVPTDHMQSKIYGPIQHGQTSMSIELYSSRNPDPRYTKGEEGVKLEGEFEVDMTDGVKDLDKKREVRVSMYFGRTSVEVKAQPVNFGSQKVYDMLPVRFEAGS